MSKENIIVAHYPDYRNGNPYQDLLAKSLKHLSIRTTFIPSGVYNILKHSCTGKENVLHLHWIDGPIGSCKYKIDLLYQLVLFYIALLIWKTRGKKIVWTVHNLSNHENKSPTIDWLNSKITSHISNNIIIHSQNGSKIFCEKFHISRSKTTVCYHGNYTDCIKYTKPQSSEGVNYLYFGRIRKYKGVLELINSFKKINGPHKLHICGKPYTIELQNEVSNLSKSDPRISLSLTYISDEKLAELFSWSHITVLPYKDVFTSGSILLSLSAGRAIISPRSGLIPEYVDEKCSILYDSNNDSGLKEALQYATTITDFSDITACSLSQAKLFDWKESAKILANIYSS